MSKNALRFNSNKIEMSQQAYNALAAFATVCMKNSEKYGGKYPDSNWRLGAPQSQYMNCIMRHLTQHLAGEVIDPTDGLPHLWKVLWNAAVAVEDSIVHPENNDLNKGTPIDLEYFSKFIDNKQEPNNDQKTTTIGSCLNAGVDFYEQDNT